MPSGRLIKFYCNIVDKIHQFHVMKKSIFFIAICLLCACGAKLAVLTQADADRGAQKFPGLSLNDLTEGQALFKMKCSQCHPLKNPTSRDEAQWRKVVPRMAAKAERKANKQKIDAATQEKILKYLITASMAGAKK